jgi:hypothetical protein
MSKVPVAVSDKTSFTKTVSESDVYAFAGLSGDFSPNHVDAEYMRKSSFGQRVAHGALSVAFMSSASAKMTTACQEKGRSERANAHGPWVRQAPFSQARSVRGHADDELYDRSHRREQEGSPLDCAHRSNEPAR